VHRVAPALQGPDPAWHKTVKTLEGAALSSLVQQKFGEAAADYAASSVHAKGLSLARLVELVAPQPSWRVLDIATGAGHAALAFAPHVAKVTASDITPEMLAEAKRLARERKLGNVVTAPAAAQDLPFPDRSFNLVTCRLAAHHFPDPAAFVREAYRVLIPGDTFALVDNIAPDRAILPELSDAALEQLAMAYNTFEKLRDPSHVRCLGLIAWSRLLGDTGFTAAASEIMDQDIEFAPWIERMRCAAPAMARLKAMLWEAPLREFLRPRDTDAGLVFSLKEAIIVARKPD
jgi:ubiquinone/menaquinone biosynthesis C-methylase UbiE